MEKDLLRWCLDPNDLRFQLFFFKLWMLTFCVNSAPVHCLRDLQTSLLNNFFIKNKSHGTIYTFKNYFVTAFSVFSCIQIDPKCSHSSIWFGTWNKTFPATSLRSFALVSNLTSLPEQCSHRGKNILCIPCMIYTFMRNLCVKSNSTCNTLSQILAN